MGMRRRGVAERRQSELPSILLINNVTGNTHYFLLRIRIPSKDLSKSLSNFQFGWVGSVLVLLETVSIIYTVHNQASLLCCEYHTPMTAVESSILAVMPRSSLQQLLHDETTNYL
jgi:hypothetical protein